MPPVWHRDVPTDIWLMIFTLLDVKSIIAFGMVCSIRLPLLTLVLHDLTGHLQCSHFFRDLLCTQRSIWFSLVDRLLRARAIAPYSYDLRTLSHERLRDLAEGETRLEHWLHTVDTDTTLNCAPLTKGRRFHLRLPPKPYLAFASLLPGGRWLYGAALNGVTGRFEAMCWDLSTIDGPDISTNFRTALKDLEPVASMSALRTISETGQPSPYSIFEVPSSFHYSHYDANSRSVSQVWRYVSDPEDGDANS